METLVKATVWLVERSNGGVSDGIVWAFDNLGDAVKEQAKQNELSDGSYVILKRWADVVAYCLEHDIQPDEFIYCN